MFRNVGNVLFGIRILEQNVRVCVCTRAYIEPNAAETANARARPRARVAFASRLHGNTCHISRNTTHWIRTNARFHVSSRGVPNSYTPARTQRPVSLPDHPCRPPGEGWVPVPRQPRANHALKRPVIPHAISKTSFAFVPNRTPLHFCKTY